MCIIDNIFLFLNTTLSCYINKIMEYLLVIFKKELFIRLIDYLPNVLTKTTVLKFLSRTPVCLPEISSEVVT